MPTRSACRSWSFQFSASTWRWAISWPFASRALAYRWYAGMCCACCASAGGSSHRIAGAPHPRLVALAHVRRLAAHRNQRSRDHRRPASELGRGPRVVRGQCGRARTGWDVHLRAADGAGHPASGSPRSAVVAMKNRRPGGATAPCGIH